MRALQNEWRGEGHELAAAGAVGGRALPPRGVGVVWRRTAGAVGGVEGSGIEFGW